MPKSWHTSNGSFQTNGRVKIKVKFFEYSTSREYYLQPDVVEYNKDGMKTPGFDLILVSKTLQELGIVLDFWTKEITVEGISLRIRDIKKLNTSSATKRAWTINNSIYQDISREPASGLEATNTLYTS